MADVLVMPAPAADPLEVPVTMDSVSSIQSSGHINPLAIMAAKQLRDDEKEHLLEVLHKAGQAGQTLTPGNIFHALREHAYCTGVVKRIDGAGDGQLTRENIEAATHLPDDERDHLRECLQRREDLGLGLTVDEAHESLEEHREVRRIVSLLDVDDDGWIGVADIGNRAVLISDDAREHLLHTCAKSVARGARALCVDEAHSALEEHREVVALIRAIESGEGRLTAHNIIAADGISEDEREHLLETLMRMKAAGCELTADMAHESLEQHREVVSIVRSIDAGDDGLISAHNLWAADVSSGVRACLTKAIEECAVRGRKLTLVEAHRVLELKRSFWAADGCPCLQLVPLV